MDEKSWQNILDAEQRLGHPTGIGRIDRGQCPRGAVSPLVCILCEFGHMLDCHYPLTCQEAECSHYKAEVANDDGF